MQPVRDDFLQWIYQSRATDTDTTQSVLRSMQQRYGDDFYERSLKRGVLKQFIQHPDMF